MATVSKTCTFCRGRRNKPNTALRCVNHRVKAVKPTRVTAVQRGHRPTRSASGPKNSAVIKIAASAAGYGRPLDASEAVTAAKVVSLWKPDGRKRTATNTRPRSNAQSSPRDSTGSLLIALARSGLQPSACLFQENAGSVKSRLRCRDIDGPPAMSQGMSFEGHQAERINRMEPT
jgi:hypothetical protein